MRYVATDPENNPLSYSLTTFPTGMTIDSDTGLIQWTPGTSQVGSHNVGMLVDDGQGGTVTQNYTIVVSGIGTNDPPIITSTPPFVATANLLYEYQVTASDPNGDSILYSLLDNPDGMFVDPVTGLLEWTPTIDQIGQQTVTVLAIDPFGSGGTQSYTITVFDDNQDPTITSSPTQLVTAGLGYVYDVVASDPDGDPLTYTLDMAPAGMTIDPDGHIEWSPVAGDVGIHRVEVTVSDGRGGSITQFYDLAVLADGQTPMVDLFVSANPVQVGTPVTFVVTARDNVRVESIELTINGTPFPLDLNGRITCARPNSDRIRCQINGVWISAC